MFVECNGDETGNVDWYEFDVAKEDEKDEEEKKWELLSSCVVTSNVAEITNVVSDVDWYGFVAVAIDASAAVVVEEEEEEVPISCEVGTELDEMVATENDSEFDDGDVLLSSCVDTSEGIDSDVVTVDTCCTTDARDKAVDVDNVVGSIKSDSDGDVDSSTKEVDKMDATVFVVTSISLSWFKEFDCENDDEERKVAVDDSVERGWDIVKYDAVVSEFNDPIEKVFEYGIIAVVDGVSVDFSDIDGIVAVDINVVLDIFVSVDVAECEKSSAVEKDSNDGLVAAADDCGWLDESNIGVDVDVDWSITDKVGGSVDKWYLDEIVIEDNSVDRIVLVFADVANSDVVSVVTKEEEGSICGDWLIVADVDWRRSEDSDVEVEVDVCREDKNNEAENPIVPDDGK